MIVESSNAVSYLKPICKRTAYTPYPNAVFRMPVMIKLKNLKDQ
jgi:hypothetical protein